MGLLWAKHLWPLPAEGRRLVLSSFSSRFARQRALSRELMHDRVTELGPLGFELFESALLKSEASEVSEVVELWRMFGAPACEMERVVETLMRKDKRRHCGLEIVRQFGLGGGRLSGLVEASWREGRACERVSACMIMCDWRKQRELECSWQDMVDEACELFGFDVETHIDSLLSIVC